MTHNLNKKCAKKVAVVTGGARRVGAAIVRDFHAQDYNVVIHYRGHAVDATALCAELNEQRADSAVLWQCELADIDALQSLTTLLQSSWDRCDVLINNASSFLQTKVSDVSLEQWDMLFNGNVRGAFFLTQAILPLLRASQGCVINITDIHATKPMRDYSVYCMAKSALHMMTLSLAKELAPTVRVNAIAPGVVDLPEGENAVDEDLQQTLLKRIPMQRFGQASDIVKAAIFFAEYSPYVTGQVLAIDGGRSLHI